MFRQVGNFLALAQGRGFPQRDRDNSQLTTVDELKPKKIQNKTNQSPARRQISGLKSSSHQLKIVVLHSSYCATSHMHGSKVCVNIHNVYRADTEAKLGKYPTVQ